MSRPTSFPSHAQLLLIRHEAQLRKQALATYGPQGVQDLAILGAILGNNIREIGRYRVTCDGQLAQGRYTIYELVHFGALAVTGRRREPKNKEGGRRRSSLTSEHSTGSNSNSSSSSSSSHGGTQLIYPATLANLFPALVFKALRRKSVRPPKFQNDDEESGSYTPSSTMFTFDDLSTEKPLQDSQTTAAYAPCSSYANAVVDPMLISEDSVLSALVQQKLHLVKDLPLPRELCFLGATSLPMPPVLRAMHIAWTMDFLNTRATTTRRQRKQLKMCTMAGSEGAATGGLEFRPDVYAHKMRTARLARAQQQQQQQKTMARSSGAVGTNASPSSTSILEENEDEEKESQLSGGSEESTSTTATTTTTTTNTTVATTNANDTTAAASIAANKAIRQEKRMVQQLLALENKVPRAVRQWAAAARPCFAEELLQEDRQVQEWVDRHRIQVVLGCGSGAGLRLGLGLGSISGARSGQGLKQRRPMLSPISTTLANSIAFGNSGNGSQHQQGHRRMPSSPLSSKVMTASDFATVEEEEEEEEVAAFDSQPLHPLQSTTRASFPEGVYLGSNLGRAGAGIEAGKGTVVTEAADRAINVPAGSGTEALTTAAAVGVAAPVNNGMIGNSPFSNIVKTRPTSANVDERLSASQQMLSMHLWLSLLVSPLSPEQMVQDQFGFLDS
ncbi:hypothetical protein EDD21DRAFT_388257 [Dissophora ornata]|nr:hypothetical protein BGZ58_002939 [Dissophora ornata]KAI8596425.1 hypothetical protein EDD21DRAFT_388257 [Dissophora ornata]